MMCLPGALVAALAAAIRGDARLVRDRPKLDLRFAGYRGRGSGGGGQTSRRIRAGMRRRMKERFAIGGTSDDLRLMRNARKRERAAR